MYREPTIHLVKFLLRAGSNPLLPSTLLRAHISLKPRKGPVPVEGEGLDKERLSLFPSQSQRQGLLPTRPSLPFSPLAQVALRHAILRPPRLKAWGWRKGERANSSTTSPWCLVAV